MQRKDLYCLLLGLASMLAAATASAEEEEPGYGSEPFLYEEELERSWIVAIEFGLLLTRGNTENSSLKGRLDATQDLPKWRNTYQAEAFSSNDKETTTAERYRASTKSDYKLFENQEYLFARLAAVDDRFTGYEYEVTSAIGYGFRAWEQELSFSDEYAFLDLEAGPGYRLARIRENQLREGEDENERAGILRLAGRFLRPLNPNTRFSQDFSTETSLIGDDNIIAESETAIVASLISSFAMKFAVNLRYVKEPPLGKKSTDSETSVTLIYAL